MNCTKEANCEILNSESRDPELLGRGRSDKEYGREIKQIMEEREATCRICRIARKAAVMELEHQLRRQNPARFKPFETEGTG